MVNNFAGTWTKGRFLHFVYPSIVLLGFVAFYNCADGYFVSRYVGSEALAALNVVHPVVSLLLGFGLMMSVGGSAAIGIKLGEGRREDAGKYFTQTLLANVVFAAAVCVPVAIFFDPVLSLLGARDAMRAHAADYLSVMLAFGPVFAVSLSFEYLARADGSPRIALIATIAGGLTNVVLDYVFLARFGWGVKGAALATGLGNIAAAAVAGGYFLSGKSTLRFRKTAIDPRFIAGAAFNGSSELVNSLSVGVVTFLYNRQTYALLGTTGVAAITALLYFNWLVVSVQIGASAGCAPLLSYAWGARNKKLFGYFLKRSLALTGALTAAALVLGLGFGPSLVSLLGGGDADLNGILKEAVRIFALQYVFSAFNIFASGFYTALGNGAVSAAISVLRSLVGSIGGVLFLPAAFGIAGLWMVGPFADVLTFAAAAIFFAAFVRRLRGGRLPLD